MLRQSSLACLVAFFLLAATGLSSAARAQSPLVIEDRPAVTKADRTTCWDNEDRFVSCFNGTATDTVTGLVWLSKASCLDLPGTGGVNSTDWATAMQAVAQLEDGICGLTDDSEPGDWRLPTAEEWETTVRYARDIQGCVGADSPTFTDPSGAQCFKDDMSFFSDLTSANYWSSTVDETNPGRVEATSLTNGNTSTKIFKFANASIWPVRDGQ